MALANCSSDRGTDFWNKKDSKYWPDLGGAVKGFKEGMKDPNAKEGDAAATAEAAPVQRVATGETIDVQAKEKTNTQPGTH